MALQKLSQAVKDPACCVVPLVWKPPLTGDKVQTSEGMSVPPQRSSRRVRKHTPTT
jgi:hypothetical protein